MRVWASPFARGGGIAAQTAPACLREAKPSCHRTSHLGASIRRWWSRARTLVLPRRAFLVALQSARPLAPASRRIPCLERARGLSELPGSPLKLARGLSAAELL